MEYILESFKQYVHDLELTTFADWGILFIAMLAVYVLGQIILKLIVRKQKFQRPLLIYIIMLLSSSLVTLGVLGYFIYQWQFTNYYVYSNDKLIHIIILFILLLVPITIVLFFRQFFERNSISEIIPFQHSRNLENQASGKARKRFNRNKFWILLPVLAFLLLLFKKDETYLVSFVIDNSSSMGQVGSGEVSPIEMGKNSIGNTLQKIDKKTVFVVSWFSDPIEENYKTSMRELTSCISINKLNAVNNYFENNQNAINYLQNLISISPTPLFEGIWSNFLFCKSLKDQYQPEQMILIIITDGVETVIPEPEHENFLFCNDQDFDDCFDRVSIINLDGDLSSPFFMNAFECGYYIEEDGMSRINYLNALEHTLKHLKKDYNFIIILSTVLVIFIFIILIIPPKKF